MIVSSTGFYLPSDVDNTRPKARTHIHGANTSRNQGEGQSNRVWNQGLQEGFSPAQIACVR